MASSYPGGLDAFSTARVDGTGMATTHAGDHNNANDAINKIEAELGINPSAAYSTVLARLDALGTIVPATTQSGTTYTLALADAGTVVEFTNAGAVALTVPLNASVAFPIGSIVGILQYGAGQVTIGGSATLRSAGSKLKTSLLYSTVWIRKRGTDEWVVTGDTTT